MAAIRATWRDFVLDVGSGSHPHSTADILVERFLQDSLGHRSGKGLVADRPLVCADIEALPFGDRTFDYVICNHVLEHVEDAVQGVRELARVRKRGYLAVPSGFYEFVCPTASHRWVFALSGDTLLIKRKEERHNLGVQMYGGLFFMLYGETDFRRLVMRRPRLFGVALEWEGSISHRVARDDEPLYDYGDPGRARELLEPVPPDGLLDAIRGLVFLDTSPGTYRRLERLRRAVRSLLRRF